MSGDSRGLGVDAHGGPVIDPTQNVLDLVTAAIKRQDDLREAESRHVREIAALRADYAAELRHAESDRLDAIRAVDVAAVASAAQVQETRATTLANTVAISAEAMRESLTRALTPLQASIDDLRRAQYEAAGQKTQVVESRGGTAQLVAIGALCVSIIVAAFLIYAAVNKK